MNALGFLKEFLASPATVGALIPSSPALALRMTGAAELPAARVVIEFGPGTGVFTEQILNTLPKQAEFFAIEINERLADATRRRCPGAIVWHDCATNAKTHLRRHGHNSCDRVLSGLPWAAFPPPLQDDLLDTILDILEPGGLFVTFAYLQGLVLPAAWAFRRKLTTRFGRGNVTTTPPVWDNLPPAFVYRARKPCPGPAEPPHRF